MNLQQALVLQERVEAAIDEMVGPRASRIERARARLELSRHHPGFATTMVEAERVVKHAGGGPPRGGS